MSEAPAFDLLIVGGGINGVGIARDAAGRGLNVLLVERDTLAAHTSSASSKLIHGGLRYLEQGAVRLVRESLRERERLMRIAPNLVRPIEFVMPMDGTPRPAWMIGLGLAIYDRLGGANSLPRSRTLDLASDPHGEGLIRRGRAFAYWDCRVDDRRLVELNGEDAVGRGARIMTGTELVEARRDGGRWRARLSTGEAIVAKVLVNAAGPWVDAVNRRTGVSARGRARLVKGSHIVLPSLFPGDHGFLLQNHDHRVIFAVPHAGGTMIGTTDVPVDAPEAAPTIGAAETHYLLAAVQRWFERPVAESDIVASWSGIRSLYDDGRSDPSRVTRDYRLDVDRHGPPLLSVFGGKITTFRRLAENALDLLADDFPTMTGAWTGDTLLPGG